MLRPGSASASAGRWGSVARDEQAQEPLTVEEQEEAAQREAAQAEGWAEGYKPLPRGEDQ